MLNISSHLRLRFIRLSFKYRESGTICTYLAKVIGHFSQNILLKITKRKILERISRGFFWRGGCFFFFCNRILWHKSNYIISYPVLQKILVVLVIGHTEFTEAKTKKTEEFSSLKGPNSHELNPRGNNSAIPTNSSQKYRQVSNDMLPVKWNISKNITLLYI